VVVGACWWLVMSPPQGMQGRPVAVGIGLTATPEAHHGGAICPPTRRTGDLRKRGLTRRIVGFPGDQTDASRGCFEEVPPVAQCTATTADGKRCRAPALQGRPFCFAHDPERAQERADARQRGGYNRRTPKATDPEGYPTRLRSVGDVQAVLERALADTWAQENSGARTQALVRLAHGALKALEVGDLEGRLAALEARLEEAAP